MKYTFTFIQLLYFALCFGQKNDSNWLFSHADVNVTQINFNTTPPNISLNPKMPFSATNATFSDYEGNLVYYTNGLKINNHLDLLIENGDSLNTGFWADTFIDDGYPVLNGAFFIEQPDDSTKCLLFHMFAESATGTVILNKMYYTLIDREANNGLGKVLYKNVPLLEGNDQLNFNHASAVKHANGRDWWIILPHRMRPIYYRFLLSPEGILGPEAQEIGYKIPTTDPHYYFGVNLFSQDGSKYVDYEWRKGEGFQIYDFDRCSGLLSNPKKVEYQTGTENVNGQTGIAFSPSGRFIYMTYRKDSGVRLVQYDLESPNIIASEFLIADCPTPVSPYECSMEYLLLGPDNRIYISALIDTLAFHTLNQPDSLGSSCDFDFGSFVFPEKHPYPVFSYFPNYRLYDVPGSPCDTLGINAPPVAASDLAKEAISFDVYPNPTNYQCNISHNLRVGQKIQINLYDLFGQLLEQQELKSPHTSISLGHLPAGIYIMQISLGGKIMKTEKIIKY